MKIVVFCKADGAISKSVLCPDGEENIQCDEYQSWIGHDPVDDSLYRVDLQSMEIVPIA